MALSRIAIFAAMALILLSGAAIAASDETRFWNLTVDTIVKFQLSPAGKSQWGEDQTANDKDHTVDPDERLKITNTPAGVYDAKFTDNKGRTCVVPNITIEAGKIFSIEETKLVGCTHWPAK